MPHISKKRVKNKIFIKIYNQLAEVIAKVDVVQSKLLMKELLTYTERIMIAKRLALILMLLQGQSIYRAVKLLKISSSTASKMELRIENGEFANLSNLLKLKSKRRILRNIINAIIEIGIPPKYGRGRWDFLDRIQKIKNQK